MTMELARFMDKVSPEPNTGCWLWLGAVNRKGYGRFGHGEMAHRTALRLLRDVAVPDGLEVDHRCRTRSCVNPAHLELVTHTENLRRRLFASSCPSGHQEVVVRRGRRVCLECARLRAFRRYVPSSSRRRRRHLAPEEKTRIRTLIFQGLSHSQIAPLLNISIGTVSRVRNSP